MIHKSILFDLICIFPRHLQGGVHGVGGDLAGVLSHPHVDVATRSPAGGPGVLHDPVGSGASLVVSDQQHGVVHLSVTAGGAPVHTTRVVLERASNMDSDGDGVADLKQGTLHGGLAVADSLVATAVSHLVVAVEPAASVSPMVRVGALALDSLPRVIEGVGHVTSLTGADSTVDQLLLTQADTLSHAQLPHALQAPVDEKAQQLPHWPWFFTGAACSRTSSWSAPPRSSQRPRSEPSSSCGRRRCAPPPSPCWPPRWRTR